MSLIKCSECGREISDKASSCPSCGNPIHTTNVEEGIKEDKKVVVIEQTSKRWKRKYLWAIAFIIGGICLFGNRDLAPLGGVLVFVGFITIIVSNIGAWWTNG